MHGRWLRNGLIYLLVLVAIVAIVFSLLPSGGSDEVDGSPQQLIQQVNAGQVAEIEVDGDKVRYELKGVEERFRFEKEQGETVSGILDRAGVPVEEYAGLITNKGGSTLGNIFGVFLNFLPIIIIVAILFFFLRQAQGSNSQAMNFGKSRARVFSGTRPTVTFLDVAGAEEPKEEVRRGGGIPQISREILCLGGSYPKGSTPCRTTWHRQDTLGKGGGWRSRGSLLFHQRLRVCGDVRWRRCLSRA